MKFYLPLCADYHLLSCIAKIADCKVKIEVDEFCRSCNVILGNRPHPSTMLRRMCYDDCSQDVFFLKPDEFHHKAVYSCTFLRVIALRRIKASFLSASSRSSASISTIPFIILVYRQVTYSINSLSSSS